MLFHLSWKELNTTFKLALPLMFSEVLQSTTPFVGVLIIARLGQQALAASALVNLAWFSLVAFSFGLLNAISILVSRLYGQNDLNKIKQVMSQAYIIVFLLAIVMVGLFLLLPYLLVWTGQPKEVVKLGGYYVHALSWAIPAFVLTVALEQFLYGLHQTRLIFIISLLQIPLEVIAMFILAFGLLGVPEFGIQGVGYGQALVFVMGIIGIILYLNWDKRFRNYQIGRFFAWNPGYFWAVFKTGLPIGMMYLVELLAFFFMGVMIAHINSIALGANQIVIQYVSIVLTVTMAISQVVTIRVGYAIGQNATQALSSYVVSGLILGLIVTLFTGIVYIVLPSQLLAINVGHHYDSGALFNYFKQLILLAGVYQIVDCLRVIVSGALRAFKDTPFLMGSSIVGYFGVAIPVGYYFGFVLNGGAAGVWWGMILGSAIGGMIVFLRLSRFWSKPCLS